MGLDRVSSSISDCGLSPSPYVDAHTEPSVGQLSVTLSSGFRCEPLKNCSHYALSSFPFSMSPGHVGLAGVTPDSSMSSPAPRLKPLCPARGRTASKSINAQLMGSTHKSYQLRDLILKGEEIQKHTGS